MQIVVIAHNIRSIYNIGSIFRTCDGFGIDHLYITGYSPYPELPDYDPRMPHTIEKLTRQIHKTAIGAEQTVEFSHHDDVRRLVGELKDDGFEIYALEQTTKSIPVYESRPSNKVALLLGEEIDGVAIDLLRMSDVAIEIPMYGTKESFNVSVATGIALYALREHKNYDIVSQNKQKQNDSSNSTQTIPPTSST